MELLWRQPRRNTLVSWPEEVDQRLDILVRAAAAVSEHASRAQVLAALVAAVEVRPDLISDLLHTYRRLPASALTDGNDRQDLPDIRSPGAPRTRSQRASDQDVTQA